MKNNNRNRESGDGLNHIEPGSWNFSNDVVNVFNQHIRKSVPQYNSAHEIIVKVSDFFLADQDKCIEMGCSTGTLIKLISERHQNKNINFVGVDESANMINFAKKNCKNNHLNFVHGDALEVDFDSTFVISAFTIQFIQPKKRQLLIDKIYKEMEWGGGFIFFEKVRGSDARFQDILTSVHWEWKMDNGFSDEEIISKWRSLKRVMEPFSDKGNKDMLKRAGFEDIETIWKWGPFQGYLAIK